MPCVRRIFWSSEHPGPIQSGSNTNLLDLRSSKAVHYIITIYVVNITNYSIVCSGYGCMFVIPLLKCPVQNTNYKTN